MIPLISGRVRGPLGIDHLARLWLKLRLHAIGQLPDGYRYGEGGSDGELIEVLGLEPSAMIAFVSDRAPDYLAFEAWVRDHARSVASPAIDAFNADIDVFEMPEPRRSAWSTRFGIASYTVAVRMNELDDWDLVHAQIVAGDAPATLMIPAISSGVTGPLELAHLARFWLKKLLKHRGRLPSEYRCGEGGFDGMLLALLGIANDDVDAYFVAAMPSYLAFEEWVRSRANASAAEIAAFTAKLRAYAMPAALAEPRRAQYGLSDSVTLGVMLNDVDDWGGLHEALLASR